MYLKPATTDVSHNPRTFHLQLNGMLATLIVESFPHMPTKIITQQFVYSQ